MINCLIVPKRLKLEPSLFGYLKTLPSKELPIITNPQIQLGAIFFSGKSEKFKSTTTALPDCKKCFRQSQVENLLNTRM